MHSGPVIMIDMDTSGDYMATCSQDRKVNLFAWLSTQVLGDLSVWLFGDTTQVKWFR